MKQFLKIFFPLAAAALLASCTSGNKKADDVLQIRLERVIDANWPKEVKDAVRNAPKDALVGVGNAKMPDLTMAWNRAELQARVDISRQLNLVTTEIVRYYTRTSQADPSKGEIFRETITVKLSETTLSGVSPVLRHEAEDGSWWIVMRMDKAALSDELARAQVSAKNDVPEMTAFDAEKLVKAARFIQEIR